MKKLLSLAGLLIIATSAVAQETYSVAIVAPANVAKIDLGRSQANSASCTRYALLATCTQAQVCVAANVPGAAACTVADAIAAGVRIYPATLAGRESFVTNELVRDKLQDFVIKRAQIAVFNLSSFCKAATQVQEDTLCTNSGQSAGCGICDSFR